MAAVAVPAGAAAATPQGAAAPPVAPPARLGAGPAPTTIARPVGALAALDPDEWALPHDSPAVAALPFLQWSLPAAGGRALVAMSELQGICITACSFDLSDHARLLALRGAHLIESGFSAAACSGILHELHDARILESVYKGEGDL
ncbi:hypothetical protein AB1Y20_003094 [Prymnesium parvum]|uniref:Uncharacterized protein n=1 Tax=Prymnesium parvum TaxID=97485 RepID=A0AB34JD26_PRYPA